MSLKQIGAAEYERLNDDQKRVVGSFLEDLGLMIRGDQIIVVVDIIYGQRVLLTDAVLAYLAVQWLCNYYRSRDQGAFSINIVADHPLQSVLHMVNRQKNAGPPAARLMIAEKEPLK